LPLIGDGGFMISSMLLRARLRGTRRSLTEGKGDWRAERAAPGRWNGSTGRRQRLRHDTDERRYADLTAGSLLDFFERSHSLHIIDYSDALTGGVLPDLA
jgi:hypothetical protein